VGDLKRIFWCGVWVIWNSFFLVRSVGDLEWFSGAGVGDLEQFFWCGMWVIWNGFS
jgi:hypothetical protein